MSLQTAMQRREFLGSLGRIFAGWHARQWLGFAAVGAHGELLGSQPVAAQAAMSAPIEVIPTIGHASDVKALAFSRERGLIASGSEDKTIKLWDGRTGRLLRTFNGHELGVTAVAFSADERLIASGSADKTVRLWDAAQGGRPLRSLAGHSENITAIAFSNDGGRIVSGSDDRSLKLWDVSTGRRLLNFTGHRESVVAVSFSPDGRRLISGSKDGTLRIWNAASGRLLRSFVIRGGIAVMAVSPDGTHALTVGPLGKAEHWDTTSGQLLQTFSSKETSSVAAVAFSQGQQAILAYHGGTIEFSALVSGQPLRRLSGLWTDFVTLAFSHDSTRVVVANADYQMNDTRTLSLRDVATGNLLQSTGSNLAQPIRVAFSPDGTRVLSCEFDRWKLWDATTGRLLLTKDHKGGRVNAAFSPDGARVVSGSPNGTLKIWDATNQSTRDLTTEAGVNVALAYSADGTRIFSVSFDGLAVWDDTTGQRVSDVSIGGMPSAADFSPGRNRLVVDGDSVIVLDNIASARASQRAIAAAGSAGRAPNALALSPDGAQVIVGTGHTMKLWDAVSGRLLRTFVGHSGPVNAAAFSPDGARLLSGSDDNTIKVWDVSSGRELRLPEMRHGGVVWAVAFSPDSARMLSCSADGTIRLWDGKTGEPLVSLMSPEDGEWIAITPEGFFAASDKAAAQVGVVRGLEAYSVDQFYQQLYRPDVVRHKLSTDPSVNKRVKIAGDTVNLARVLANKAPPEIAIVSPQSSSELAEQTVIVEARLFHPDMSNNGGIGRVEWRVNGVPRTVEDLQHFSAVREHTIRRQLTLPSDRCVIELVAYNKANLTASRPAAVTVTVRSAAPRPHPTLHVLAIGVDRYKAMERLNFSVADAKSIMAAFELLKSDKTVYSDVVGHGLFDEQVTRQSVQAEFKRLSAIVQTDDTFVLYLAGHGVTIDGRFYFLPHNATGSLSDLNVESAIGQNQLQDWLTEIPAFKSVVIYDACESGSTTEDRSGIRGLQQFVAVEKLSRSLGRTVLSATTDVTAALEGYKGHGVFTYVLLDAFSHADLDNDGRITTEELATYLRARLPALTDDLSRRYPELGLSRQEPQVKAFGAPFTLMPRAASADIERIR